MSSHAMKQWINTVAILSFLAVSASLTQAATNIFIPFGSSWRYLDNGSDQGVAWRATAFNDASWASGPPQLGYSSNPAELDEATTVSFGPDAANKYITTYFRRAFNVSNVSSYINLTLNLVRDGGGVVYLNGTEIYRTPNMP